MMRQPNATKLAKRLYAYMSSPDYEGGDGPATALGKIKGVIRAEYCDLEVEVSRLNGVIVRVFDEIHAAPELNMDNYDVEQVRQLNDGICDICCWLEAEARKARKMLPEATKPGGE